MAQVSADRDHLGWSRSSVGCPIIRDQLAGSDWAVAFTGPDCQQSRPPLGAGLGAGSGERRLVPASDAPLDAVETLKVSTRSNPNSVAGALAGVLRTSGEARVQVVGAGALNQAIKAIAIARGYVDDVGIDLVCAPSFAEIEIEGASRTAICLDLTHRSNAGTDDATRKSAG